jgi:invasion protein IalB
MYSVAQQRVSTARIGVITLLCLLSFGSGSLAQTLRPKDTNPAPTAAAPAQPEPQKPTWMVNCTNVPGGFDCRASQTLYFTKTRSRALTLVVQTRPSAKKPVLLMQVPLGVYLPAGVTLQIGKDAAKTLPIQSCNQEGCFTEYALTDADISAMLKEADLTVSVQDLKKTPGTFKVPGLGFAAAFSKMK